MDDSPSDGARANDYQGFQALDEPEISEDRSEAATTHVDSDILGKPMADFMIPWVERVVLDNKMFDLVK